MREFVSRNKIPIIITAGFMSLIGLYLWMWTPYPYNPRYIVNRILFSPTYLCRDGVYSWAKQPNGTCSNHGGIRQALPK